MPVAYVSVFGSGTNIAMGQIVAESGRNIYSSDGASRSIARVNDDGTILLSDGTVNYPYYLGMQEVEAVNFGWPTGTNVTRFAINLGESIVGATGGGIMAKSDRTTFWLGGNYTSRAT